MPLSKSKYRFGKKETLHFERLEAEHTSLAKSESSAKGKGCPPARVSATIQYSSHSLDDKRHSLAPVQWCGEECPSMNDVYWITLTYHIDEKPYNIRCHYLKSSKDETLAIIIPSLTSYFSG